MPAPKWTPAAEIVLDSLNAKDLELFNAVEVILAEWKADEPESYNRTHEVRMLGELVAIVDDFRRNRVVRGEAAKLAMRIVEEANQKFGPTRGYERPAPTAIPGA